LTKEPADKEAITASVKQMVAEVQTYVPGYRLLNDPIVDGNRVTISVEVEGLGDFLPKYAGNLDIMTSAALKTAEMIARRKAQAA
jgi:acetaldehyde/propanal dehydrogenase